jgi:hypothetical protein
MGTERDFKVKKGLSVEGGDITVASGNSVLAPTFDTNVTTAGVTLSGTTLAADGTDPNIGINITPAGNGSVTITKVDIDGGTIDGATIATSDITVGSSKTLNVSAGTLTLADDQISGDKIEGGTIGSVTITNPTITNVPSNIQEQDALLDRLSDLVMGADKIAYFTGVNGAALTSFTSQARALLDDTSFSDIRIRTKDSSSINTKVEINRWIYSHRVTQRRTIVHPIIRSHLTSPSVFGQPSSKVLIRSIRHLNHSLLDR